MNKCIKFLFCVFILVSISGCTGDSSEGFFLGKKPEYEVKNETRNKTIILRATLKSGEVSNVGIESGRRICFFEKNRCESRNDDRSAKACP